MNRNRGHDLEHVPDEERYRTHHQRLGKIVCIEEREMRNTQHEDEQLSRGK